MVDTIKIADKDYEVHALTIKQMRLIMPLVRTSKQAVDSETTLGNMSAAVAIGLSKAYPEVTQDLVEDNLTFLQIGEALEKIASASGISKKVDGVGEAPAENQTS